MPNFALKIGLSLALSILVAACQGLYVAGDAGTHATRAPNDGPAAPIR